jgi:hypothetical protein
MGRHGHTTVTSVFAAPATAAGVTCLSVLVAAALLLGLPDDVSSWRAINQGRECAVPSSGCVENRSALLVREEAGSRDYRRKYCLPGTTYGSGCVRLPAIDVIRTKGALDDATPDVAVIHRGELVAVRTSAGAELRGFDGSAVRWLAPLFLVVWLGLVAVAGVVMATRRRRAGWRWFAREGPWAPMGGVTVALAVAWLVVGMFDVWVYQLMGQTTAITVALVGVGAVSYAIVRSFAAVRERDGSRAS